MTGIFVFLGLALALHGFGLIGGWNAFTGEGTLFQYFQHPWYIAGALFWFGAGVLFFVEDPVVREENATPLINEHVHARYMRNMSVVQDHLAKENFKEAVELLSFTLEDMADQLQMREV